MSVNIHLSRAERRALELAIGGGLFKVCGPRWFSRHTDVDLQCMRITSRVVATVTVNRLVARYLLVCVDEYGCKSVYPT